VVSHPARASLRQLLRKGERVGFGVGQVVRRGGMPMRLLARRASERLTLARRRGFKERSIRIVGLKRSFLVTVVLVLVMLATILGCLRGFVLPEAAASADRNGRLKKGIA
jgi:hypothetical protein